MAGAPSFAQSVQAARDTSWVRIAVFVLILVVGGGVAIYLGYEALHSHHVVTSNYAKITASGVTVTTLHATSAVAVSAPASSQAAVLAVISVIAGCVSALAAVAALVVPFFLKRGGASARS